MEVHWLAHWNYLGHVREPAGVYITGRDMNSSYGSHTDWQIGCCRMFEPERQLGKKRNSICSYGYSGSYTIGSIAIHIYKAENISLERAWSGRKRKKKLLNKVWQSHQSVSSLCADTLTARYVFRDLLLQTLLSSAPCCCCLGLIYWLSHSYEQVGFAM